MPANLVFHERYPFAFYCFHNDRSRHSFHSLCLVKSSAQLPAKPMTLIQNRFL